MVAICVQEVPSVERSILKPSSSDELSFHVRLICVFEIAVAVKPLGTAGVEAGAATVMVTVATALSSAPSLTLNVKLVVPDHPMFGVNVRFAPVPLNVPLAGLLTTV